MSIYIDSKVKELEGAIVGKRNHKIIIYLQRENGIVAISFEDFLRNALEEQEVILSKS